MAFKRFSVSNVDFTANGTSGIISGKNGFVSQIGVIPVLIDSVAIVDGSTNLQFTANSLSLLHDSNFSNNILEVNDGFFQGIKGLDYIGIPVNQKLNTFSDFGFVGFNPTFTQISANIVSHNLTSNTITIENTLTQTSRLVDKLPDTPFYAQLSQIVTPEYFDSKEFYISGSNLVKQKFVNTSSNTSSLTVDIGVRPRFKKEIKIWLDGIEVNESDFTWDNTANITVDVTNKDLLRARVNTYTVPAIEQGDNVFVIADNSYSIANVSYDSADAFSNSSLTDNYFYKVKLTDNIRANVSGLSLVNKSLDIEGTINNVYSSNNTFTLDYNENVFFNNFRLANSKIYIVQSALSFTPITLGSDKVLRDVPRGLNLVRARNKNSQARVSDTVTKSVFVDEIPIKKVENININESLFIDTNQGVSVKITVVFDAIENQEVTDYEVSYRLNNTSGDLTNFNTVKLPSVGISEDGKMRFTINNVDRGTGSESNSITIRITPLNRQIRGITAEQTKEIVGKTASPNAVQTVFGGQQGENIFLGWTFLLNSNGTVVDLDLQETLIRKVAGEIAEADALDAWNSASTIARVATPATSISFSIDTFGITETYLFRTRDTSGNISEDVKALTIATFRPANTEVFKVYSEDDPSGNVITGLPNDNATENNYPSFSDSATGGLVDSGHEFADLANGTSSGWTSLAEVTDLSASGATAFYQTQVRDIGVTATGILTILANGVSTLASTWNSLLNNVVTGVSDAGSASNVLVDSDFGGIGTVLGFNNVNAATVSYDANNDTLISGGSSGNVYAIWNYGQFAADGSNANSFSLIAGTINTNAIELGASYYANGEPTGTNSMINLNSSTSYALVNLSQFIDDEGSVNFLGPDEAVTSNILIRYSTTDPFYANGNVNVSVFSSTASTDSEGWKIFNGSKRTYRYFQLKYQLFNDNPTQADFVLDKFNYVLDLEDKIYTEKVAITTSPQQINYSSEGFIQSPLISMTVENADQALVPVTVDIASKDAVNVNVYSNTGVAQTGINVYFTASGV